MISISNVKPLSYKEMKAVVGTGYKPDSLCCRIVDGGVYGPIQLCDSGQLNCNNSASCPFGYICVS